MFLCIETELWVNRYIIQCCDIGILNSICEFYSGTLSENIDKLDNDIYLSIDIGKYSYTIKFNNQTLQTESPIDLVHRIVFSTAKYHPQFFPLHAGAIVAKDKAQIFIAPSMTGKTTLIMYLVLNGYMYINDDLVAINMNTIRAYPNITPARIRPQSISVLMKNGCSFPHLPLTNNVNNRIVYMPDKYLVTDIEVDNIFILQRNSTTNSCVKLPSFEAINSLLKNLITVTTDTLQSLRYAIQLAPKCKKLFYKDLSYVVKILERGI